MYSSEFKAQLLKFVSIGCYFIADLATYLAASWTFS